MLNAVVVDCSKAHAFKYRVSAQATRHLKHALDSFGASFFHHIGRAKSFGQSDAVAMMPQHNDLFGAKSARGNYAEQSYRAVTYNSHNVAGRNLRTDGRVMACAHDIRQGK